MHCGGVSDEIEYEDRWGRHTGWITVLRHGPGSELRGRGRGVGTRGPTHLPVRTHSAAGTRPPSKYSVRPGPATAARGLAQRGDLGAGVGHSWGRD